MSEKHQQICQPVAAQLRRSMWLACTAQAIKLLIWTAMLGLIHYLSQALYWQTALLAAALLLMSVAYYTLKIRAHDASHYAAYDLEEILRTRLAAKIARLPIGHARQIGSGGLAKILLDDVHALHAYVADAPPLKAEAYVTPVLVSAVLLYLNWPLALAVLLFCALAFGALNWLFRRGQNFRRQYSSALAQVNAAIIEYVQGMATVRTFDAGDASYGRYQQALNHFHHIMQRWLAQTGAATRVARSLFTPMPMLLFLLLLMLFWPHERADAFTWFAFFLLAAGIVETMHPYMGLYHLLEKSRASIERIFELEAMSDLPEPALPQSPSRHDIRYEHVFFRYHEHNANALQNINLHIPEHSFTAVVGASGSGKTTLVSLLPRFWDVSSGSISIGGVDIRHMAQTDLMSRCSFVFQDNFLFSCSIADNIRYGLAGIDDEAVVEAAKKAEIHDFIMTLPEQYQTRAGERGQLLSGGQKQRLTIARAFLQNRPILILDEPTAFADARNEALLLQAFRRLMQQRTVIMIAHRLANIVEADQIICMQHGEIVAQGNHQTLLEQSAFYRQLWHNYRQTQSWHLSTKGETA